MDEALVDYTAFKWIPLELAKNPGNWPMCADFMEDLGRYEDAECLRLADSLAVAMVWCPPGEFLMHASTHPDYRGEKFVPVTITRSFWIGKYPVTHSEWHRTLNIYPGSQSEIEYDRFGGYTYDDPSDLPRQGVGFGEAKSYVSSLNLTRPHGEDFAAKWAYTLPTEAQWEYACRAGTTTKFYFGDDADQGAAYCDLDTDYNGAFLPVGRKKPNPWGIYDMYDSVMEWCQDGWCNVVPGGVDPVGDRMVAASPHVLRGCISRDNPNHRTAEPNNSALRAVPRATGFEVHVPRSVFRRGGLRLVVVPSDRLK